jgi:hypothetical protein
MRVAASVAIVDRFKAEGRGQRSLLLAGKHGLQQLARRPSNNANFVRVALGERDREILGLLQRDMRRAAAALPGRS